MVRRFARGAEDERISSRDAGGEEGDDGCNGDVGGVFNRSDRSIKKCDISVVRNLCQSAKRGDLL